MRSSDARPLCGILAAVLTSALPALALAVPLQLAHQGRLLDAAEAPLEGTHELKFRLYDAPTGGSLLWVETVSETFTGGFYSTVLGADDDNSPLDDGIFAAPPIYLELTVDDGDPLLPRQEINSVPFALRAGTAENVDGGYVDASDVSIDGQLVIDADGNWVGPTAAVDWGDLTGIPAALDDGQDADSLAGLSCADGARPQWDESSGLWICSAVAWTEIVGIPVEVTSADADTLGALVSCTDGGVAKFSVGTGLWVCGTDSVLGSSDVVSYVDGATVDLGPGSSMGSRVLATVDDLTWSALVGVPPELADGIDADTLAALGASCADGDRAAWDSVLEEWTCVGEQVELERLDTTGVDDGHVLTVQGGAPAWVAPAASPPQPCTLSVLSQAIGTAVFTCDGEIVPVRTRQQFTSIDAGSSHACGVRLDGRVSCWGDDGDGRASPPSGEFVEVAAGSHHSCGIRPDQTIECWGRGSSGEATPPGGAFIDISAGVGFTCGVQDDGLLACWGTNANGETSAPAGTFAQVSAGGGHACAVEAGGELFCWGVNGNGEATPPSGTFVAVSAGSNRTCAVAADGSVSCWGLNATAPPGTFQQVGAGNGHDCALSVQGAITCWGQDNFSQSTPPDGVFGLLAVGDEYTCGALDPSGALGCWGHNFDGQTEPP